MFLNKKIRSSFIVGATALFGTVALAGPLSSPKPRLDGYRVKDTEDLTLLSYNESLYKAMDQSSKWFWSELGVEPPKDLLDKMTSEEGERFNLRMQNYDEAVQNRLRLEQVVNRSFLWDNAKLDPLKETLPYEEKIQEHARRFEYFMEIAQKMKTAPTDAAAQGVQNVSQNIDEIDALFRLRPEHPLDPMHPERWHGVLSPLEAEILALREMQYAYVESEKYSGWTPRFGKIAAWVKSITEKLRLWAPTAIAVGSAYHFGGQAIADLGESPQPGAEITALAITGGGAYICASILSKIPKAMIANAAMPYVNSWLVPRYTRKTMRAAFGKTERGKQLLKNLEEFSNKKKRRTFLAE